MKYFVGFITFLLLLSFRPVEGIYDITIKTIDGDKIELSQYRGKKILFILLPISVHDTSVSINNIATLQTKYQNSLVIIGVPYVEAGFKTQDAGKLKKAYMDAGANFIIAEGMKVKKGTGQSSLFQWLTSKDMNHHFNQEGRGAGSKFFIDEEGDLYAVMGPNLKLKNPIIDRILTRLPNKKNSKGL